ncbi:VanZ family protein [Nocardioides sp. NPDC023903]|uniref:VanZ family protein n=1 Tax=Nocardioides sp. NPDC023903 TaxID=3157195 RepID=UPI0033F39618
MVNESGSLTFTGIALLTILALPVAVLAVPVLAMLRRALGVTPGRAWRTSLAEVAIVYGTVPFVLLTMVPGPMAGLVDGSVSLVPLADLPTMTTVGVVGNLLLFAAAGFFGPIRFRALRSVGRVLALGVAGSVTIETLQYTLRLDRVSSIDDVLLNAGGAALAAILSWPWWRRRRSVPPTSDQRRGDLVEAGSA